MAKKKRTSWIVWLRRLTQTGFFLLFCYLFLQTVYHPINKAGRGVTFFFNLDPLVALSSWLASHTLVAGVDQVAVDALGATLLGYKPESIGYIAQGNARGLGAINFNSLSPKRIEV